MNVLEKPVPATVIDLVKALESYFQPLLTQVNGRPVGNAYWIDAATHIWLVLEAEEARRKAAEVAA